MESDKGFRTQVELTFTLGMVPPYPGCVGIQSVDPPPPAQCGTARLSFSRLWSYAIASDEEAIGGIGLRWQQDVHRRSAEIGYWVGEPFWGQGIATKAVRALTEYAFVNPGLIRIYASVFELNPASARVLEKAGYTYEGRLRKSVTKDGITIDQLLYAIVRE